MVSSPSIIVKHTEQSRNDDLQNTVTRREINLKPKLFQKMQNGLDKTQDIHVLRLLNKATIKDLKNLTKNFKKSPENQKKTKKAQLKLQNLKTLCCKQ